MFYVLISLLSLNIFTTLCQQQSREDEDEQRAEQQKMGERHDGVKRVIEANGKTLEKLLKKNDLVVMMFWIDGEKKTEKISEKDVNFLEVIAQLFVGRKVGVAICEILSNQKFARDVGVRYTGMMKIFNRGRTSTYFGQRTTDVLFPYLAKMLTSAVTVIQTKAEKKQYDTNDLPKVIAYVAAKSKELKEVSNAALSFQPMIPVYVVHDAKLAKSCHLKRLNSLQLAKPYEKAITYSAKKGLTEESIVRFVTENKKQRVTKMRLENLHEVWAIDGKGFVLPVFASLKTEEGNQFFALVKSLAKHFEKNRNLSFVWIDPDPFPAMVDYWSQSFDIDPTKPTFGVVDVHTQTSAWFPKAEGGYVLNDMKKWVNDILNEKVTLVPMKSYKPPSRGEKEEEDESSEDSTGDESAEEIVEGEDTESAPNDSTDPMETDESEGKEEL